MQNSMTIYRAYNAHGVWSGAMGPQPVGTITTIVQAFEALAGKKSRDYDFASETGELSLYFEDGKAIVVLSPLGKLTIEA